MEPLWPLIVAAVTTTGCTCPTDDEIDAAIPTTIHRPQEGR